MKFRKYQINILVDEEVLKESYLSNNYLEEGEELPDLEDMVRSSFQWILQDGIDVIGDLVEVPE